MELLRNADEFKMWKGNNIFLGDTAEEPREYPCYVRLEVQSWQYEEECAVYLYRSDLEKMLADMEPPKC